MTTDCRPEALVRAFTALGAAFLFATACAGSEGPAGPPGPPGSPDSPAILVTRMGTGSLVVNDTVFRYSALPGLAADLAVPAGMTFKLLVETDGGIQVNATDPIAACFIDVAVFVDGVQVGSGRRVSASNSSAILYSVSSYGFSVETTIPAGTHTVAVMAKLFPSLVAECYISSGAAGSGLPGNPRLQGTMNIVAFP
jgi:hypothetical protein